MEKKECKRNSEKVKYLVIKTKGKMKEKQILKMKRITSMSGKKLKNKKMSNREDGNQWEL